MSSMAFEFPPNAAIARYSRSYVDEDETSSSFKTEESEDSSEKDVIVVQPDIILDEPGEDDFEDSDEEDRLTIDEDDGHIGSSISSLNGDFDEDDNETFEYDCSIAELCTTEHAVVDAELPEIKIYPKILPKYPPPLMPITDFDRPFGCEICPKTFKYNSDLKKHFRTHTGERPYVCKMCGKAFSRTSHLTAHMRVHTGDRPYECDMCDKKFKDKSILGRHQRLHNEKKFECEQCHKVFLRNSDLKSHERCHLPPPILKCDECDKEFRFTLHLEVHKKTHAIKREELSNDILSRTIPEHLISSPTLTITPKPKSVSNNKVPIPILPAFKPIILPALPPSIEVTRSSKNKGSSSVLSPLSLAQLTQQAALTTIQSAKEYECDFCKKTFLTELELKKHKRTHTAERPFICKVCMKAFSCFSQLEIHNRVHTGELPYRCDICNKLFNQRSNLQTHKKRHLGTITQKCAFCDKVFSSSKQYKNHLREHASMWKEPPPLMPIAL